MKISYIGERLIQPLRSAVRLSGRWKILTLRKLLYFPRLLSPSEKRLFGLLLVAALASAATLAVRGYVGLTHPVPKVGGSYTEGVIGTPQTLNPLYATKDVERDLSRLVFSGLIRYDGEGNVQTDLAERYEISPEGKTYTLTLKPDLAWHDGQPLTSEDVVFTVKRIQNPQYKSPFRPNWLGVEVEAPDQHSVRFTLRTPYAPFIENLTQGIIPKHLWENVETGQMLLNEQNLSPIGSGPFKIKRFRHKADGSILWFILERNPDYHLEGPYLEQMTLTFFNSEEEMAAAWRRADIEGFGPLSAPRVPDFSQERVNIRSLATPRIFSLFFNQRRSELLADKRVRTAIAHALDKRRIAEEAAGRGASPSDALLPHPGAGLQGEIAVYQFDPDKSRALLETAGWKDADQDGVYEKSAKKKGKTETVRLEFRLSTGDSPELKRVSALVKEMLGQAGISLTVEERSFADLESSVIRPRNFEMLLFGQVYGYEPDPFSFWHSSQIKDPGLNVSLFANKRSDRALEEARRLSDRTARASKYREFAQVAAEELPAVPLYTQLYLYLLPRGIQGVSLSEIGLPADRFNQINLWYRETGRAFR